jgi:predicted ester cyclase
VDRVRSGEVAHPDVIETVRRLNECANRHDWDAIATSLAGATYINRRQLARAGTDTIDDYLSSIRTLASLVPDLRAELAEVLAQSAMGLVAHMVLKGTSTDGVAIEISIVQITLLDADRVIHVEAFDHAQRDVALARFEELNRSR